MNRQIAAGLVALAVVCGHDAMAAQSKPATQPDRLTVFVTAPTRDGFIETSKDIDDSIKDLRSRIDQFADMRSIDKREGADVVLIVVTRGIGQEKYGDRLTFINQYYKSVVVTATPVFATTKWLSTILEVGDYRKEIVGASTEGELSFALWGSCASQVANSLRSWAVANAAQLKARRGKLGEPKAATEGVAQATR